ncbi:tumor necrosis factor ligand superfamily member 6-like [Lates japonicus]
MTSTYRKSAAGAADSEDGYVSLHLVDSSAAQPPLPPGLRHWQRRVTATQTLLLLLVCLALCGMAIEACFIFRLYQHESPAAASSFKLVGGEDVTSPTKRPSYDIRPSKPVAHLTDGPDAAHGPQIMAWSMDADPILYEMDYKDSRLLIKKEGYYYVYSKVYFLDSGVFHHSVHLLTTIYSGGSITLLQSRKYSPASGKTRSNSYLGGVFHLYRDDALYVKVSNTTKIERHKSFENVFGAYMI